MRSYETVKNELDYLLDTENRRPQDSSFEALTCEFLLDCRVLLQVLVEMSGVQLWGEDDELEADSDSG